VTARTRIDRLFEEGLKLFVQVVYASGDEEVFPALVSRETRPDCRRGRRGGKWRLTMFKEVEVEDDKGFNQEYSTEGVVHINFNLKNLSFRDVCNVPNIRAELADAYDQWAGRADDPVREVKLGTGELEKSAWSPRRMFETNGDESGWGDTSDPDWLGAFWMAPDGTLYATEGMPHEAWAADHLGMEWDERFVSEGPAAWILYGKGWRRIIVSAGLPRTIWVSGGNVNGPQKDILLAQAIERECIVGARKNPAEESGWRGPEKIIYTPPVSEGSVEEGRLKSIAAAGLMGLASIRGAQAHHAGDPETKVNPADPVSSEVINKAPDDGYGDWDQSFDVKVSTNSDSMGEPWMGRTFKLRRVGNGAGQVPFQDILAMVKAGKHPVVQRKNTIYGEERNHWGQGAYDYIIHRVVRIDHWGRMITKGDNNDKEDPGFLTPANTHGVVVSVDNPEKGATYDTPHPTKAPAGGAAHASESVRRLLAR
jgi:hypothetical protein